MRHSGKYKGFTIVSSMIPVCCSISFLFWGTHVNPNRIWIELAIASFGNGIISECFIPPLALMLMRDSHQRPHCSGGFDTSRATSHRYCGTLPCEGVRTSPRSSTIGRSAAARTRFESEQALFAFCESRLGIPSNEPPTEAKQ